MVNSLTGWSGKIYIVEEDGSSVLIGGIDNVSLNISTDAQALRSVGTPYPIDVSPMSYTITFRASIAVIDSLEYLEKILGKVSIRGFTGTTTDNVASRSDNTLDTQYPTGLYEPYKVSIKLFGYHSANDRDTITIKNVVFTNYNLTFRVGSYWLQDIEGMGTMITTSD